MFRDVKTLKCVSMNNSRTESMTKYSKGSNSKWFDITFKYKKIVTNYILSCDVYITTTITLL